jgi:hypothetical protein
MSHKSENEMNFNIYYLNFSKVFEISMMINNEIKSGMQREKGETYETTKKSGVSLNADLGSNYLAKIKSGISAESSNRSANSSKLIESLDVITTKSILLREIVNKCKNFTDFDKCNEGDLLKIDKVNLSVLDDELLRQILILRKDALKGLTVEGFEVNNLITSMLQDYSYILKGNLNNSDDLIMIKIPMEIEDEFESKYNVYDLLIGHLSVIGIYKGIVKENFVKTNIFSYFANMDPTQNLITDTKVKPSSSAQVKDLERKDKSSISNNENNFHFIDVIALIQDVEFEQQTDGIVNEVSVDLPWYKRIFNLFFRRHE